LLPEETEYFDQGSVLNQLFLSRPNKSFAWHEPTA
jgi:hypothetical protein